MTTISWSSFVLVALIRAPAISKVREKYPCRTTVAVVLPSDNDGEVIVGSLSTSPLSLASTWTDQRSRTHSSRVGCKPHCCAHGHRHRSGGRVKSRVSFTKSANSFGHVWRRRRKRRESQMRREDGRVDRGEANLE